LGLRGVDAGTVLAWYRDIVGAVTAITAGDALPPAAATAMTALDAHVRAGLAASGDSVLREATRTLDDADIVANAAVMMFGGIETTEGMFTNALLHLMSNPVAFAAVLADPVLAGAAVEESLRLQPAAAVIDRYATSDVELGGMHIAEGDLVRVSITAANRDPAVVAFPDRYDLARDNLRSQLAFASGPHICIAMDLARLEARIALSAVLASLPGLRLSEPAEALGLVFRKPSALRVRWDTD
jgi:cytochrome P450